MSYVDVGLAFDKYPIKFPVEQPISIIYGENGTGKTKTLEALVEYYESQGENVLYFPHERIFNLSEEEVEAMIVMAAITDEVDIFTKLDIKLNKWDYANKKGEFVGSGYLQVVNYIGTIYHAKTPSIVIIDGIERSLHINLMRYIIGVIDKLPNTKKLIATTHSPDVFNNNMKEEYVPVGNCVKLGW